MGQTPPMRTLPMLFLLLCGCPPIVDPPAEMTLVGEGLDEALLSVRATGPDDVWFVGSDQGAGPALLQWDGSAWTRHDTAALDGVNLWWVHPTADTVFVAGSGGTLASLDRSSGAITRIDGPRDTLTFFGIWGASAQDMWAVGAAIGAGEPPSIWRNAGGAWAEVDTTAEPFHLENVSLFKVHGSAADDVWIVGTRGLILHWDGATFTDLSPPDLDQNLLTVEWGEAGPIVVGGLNQGLIFEREGEAWVDVTPDLTPALNGVCQGSSTVAVGRWGGMARRVDGAWALDDESLTLLDYHGCLTTSDGAIWAVGGHISASPLNEGLIAYQGPATVPSPTP